MIVTLTHVLRGFLADEDHGVNSYLSTVPRFDDHRRPPNVKEIHDPSTLAPLEFELIAGQDWPAIMVNVPDTVDLTGPVDVRTRRAVAVPIVVSYRTADPDPLDAYTAAGYTLRAALQSFRYWFHSDQLNSRDVNNVQLLAMTEARIGGWRTTTFEGNPVFQIMDLSAALAVADTW